VEGPCRHGQIRFVTDDHGQIQRIARIRAFEIVIDLGRHLPGLAEHQGRVEPENRWIVDRDKASGEILSTVQKEILFGVDRPEVPELLRGRSCQFMPDDRGLAPEDELGPTNNADHGGTGAVVVIPSHTIDQRQIAGGLANGGHRYRKR